MAFSIGVLLIVFSCLTLDHISYAERLNERLSRFLWPSSFGQGGGFQGGNGVGGGGGVYGPGYGAGSGSWFGGGGGLGNLIGSIGSGGGVSGGGGFGGSSGALTGRTPISDCATTDGNRTGVCVRSSSQCIQGGGRVLGGCFATPFRGSAVSGQGLTSSGYPGISSGGFAGSNTNQYGIPIGVCCFYEVTCGGTITQNGTYFRNPNAPAPFTDSRTCSVTIRPVVSNICQIRLDFLIFEIARPKAGICETDRFVVNGHSQNFIVPPICGHNSGQHMYVDVRDSGGPTTLNILTRGSRNRQFDIRVTQIHCNSVYLAPENCLQYETGLIGSIRSFNYQEYSTGAIEYLSSLDYTICFKKAFGHCSVTYSIPSVDEINQINPGTGIIQPGQNVQYDASIYFAITPDPGLNADTAGAGPYECPTDWLMLGGVRLCGNRLNPSLSTSSPTSNTEVVDNSTGPIYARFYSNNDHDNKRGFWINYRQNPCFVGG